MNFLLYSSARPSTRCSSLDGAERGGDQRLRLAALEEGRAVRPRQHADLAGDGPQLLGGAAVDALAFQDQVADDALFQGVEGGGHLRRRVLRLSPSSGRYSGDDLSRAAP